MLKQRKHCVILQRWVFSLHGTLRSSNVCRQAVWWRFFRGWRAGRRNSLNVKQREVALQTWFQSSHSTRTNTLSTVCVVHGTPHDTWIIVKLMESGIGGFEFSRKSSVKNHIWMKWAHKTKSQRVNGRFSQCWIETDESSSGQASTSAEVGFPLGHFSRTTYLFCPVSFVL